MCSEFMFKNSVFVFFRKSSGNCKSHALDKKEHLTSGFFKIRSKNLDLLVKKDYYENR